MLQELEDMSGQLARLELSLRRQLHIAALGGVEASSEVRLFNLYFQNYYKDAFKRLSNSQRLSYQLIHGLVDAFNRDLELFPQYVRAVVEQIQTSSPDERERLGRLWVDRMAATYTSIRTLQWHVAYHLDNKANPALDLLGPTHKTYAEYQKTIDGDIKKIVESSKTTSLADFQFETGIGDRMTLPDRGSDKKE